MASSTTTKLPVSAREPDGSRANRRLRREGQVPGVVYGGGEDPVSFAVGARELRNALATTGAVFELDIDGGATASVVLKHQQRHPVTGDTMHVDFLRVRLDKPIHAVVALVVTGEEEAPGVKAGGILEQPLREVNVEALPTAIPDEVSIDASALEIGETLTVSAIQVPAGVTILDDPDAAAVTVTVTRKVQEGLEEETELVGEGGAEAEAEAEGETAAEAEGGSEDEAGGGE